MSCLAQWVVGSVDDNGFCAWSEFTGQLLSRESPVRTGQASFHFLKINKIKCITFYFANTQRHKPNVGKAQRQDGMYNCWF